MNYNLIYCFGDSNTVGYGASSSDKSYVGLLKKRFVRTTFVNRAIGGTKIDQHYNEQIKNTFVGLSSASIFLTGYNDMRFGTDLNIYKNYLEACLNQLTLFGGKVYLGECLRMTSSGYVAYPGWDKGNDYIVSKYNEIIRSFASYKVIIIPASTIYNPINVHSDLVHPNDAGHSQIYDAFMLELDSESDLCQLCEH